MVLRWMILSELDDIVEMNGGAGSHIGNRRLRFGVRQSGYKPGSVGAWVSDSLSAADLTRPVRHLSVPRVATATN